MRFVLPLVALLGLAATVQAVINAGLQPYDLYHSRYSKVSVLEITAVDSAAAALDVKVVKSLKGDLPEGAAIRMELTGEMKTVFGDAVQSGNFAVGKRAVVFAGRTRRPKDLMVYAGTFYLGEMADAAKWNLDASGANMVGNDGKEISTLAGTWNGDTAQFVRMMEDLAAGRDFFPHKAYVRFQSDVALDKLAGPVTGLGIYDLEGDGDEDVIACSPAGARIYLQGDPMQFADATKSLGIESKARSCAVADVNGDGLTDLLLGGTLHLGKFAENRFSFQPSTEIVSGATTVIFAELNGDGFPDLVASMEAGGLKVFQNSAGIIENVTTAMGLDGIQGTGYVTAGDWNGDRLADLFFAAGPGHLLVQIEGKFQPVKHDIRFKFDRGTGAGVFTPILNGDRNDLIVPLTDGWIVVANDVAGPRDLTPWGNEISEGSNDHLATISDDWNLDGYPDLFTISKAENGHNRYIINRGYGSFMLSTTHRAFEHVFSGPALETGGQAVASGDLNGDGAPDLVIGNGAGVISLLVNDTLATRVPTQHPPREVAALEAVKLVTVRVLGSKGVVNARIRLKDADGNFVARRDLGLNSSGGNAGSNQVTFAVRKPGNYTVSVEYADGLKREAAADVTTAPRQLVNVDRGEKKADDVF